jgi:hypothetical protein
MGLFSATSWMMKPGAKPGYIIHRKCHQLSSQTLFQSQDQYFKAKVEA